MTMRRLLLFLFSHRALALLRWDFHFLGIRLANFLFQKRKHIRVFASSRPKPVYLNLGSGPRGLDDPHWVNVDGFRDKNVRFLLDFNRGLPFADGTFDGIFCEHVLEHFSLEDGEKLMREAYRCLRRGGVVRIVVPDAERIIKTYFEDPAKLIRYKTKGQATAMEAVNLFFRQRYEHQFLYDWISVQAMLLRAGFGKVMRVAHGQSELCLPVVLDDPKYEWESLYVEASK